VAWWNRNPSISRVRSDISPPSFLGWSTDYASFGITPSIVSIVTFMALVLLPLVAIPAVSLAMRFTALMFFGICLNGVWNN